jgi:hypothetical protein
MRILVILVLALSLAACNGDRMKDSNLGPPAPAGADPSAASETNAGKEGTPTKAKNNKDGSRARSEGDNDEACFPAKAAGSSEG